MSPLENVLSMCSCHSSKLLIVNCSTAQELGVFLRCFVFSRNCSYSCAALQNRANIYSPEVNLAATFLPLQKAQARPWQKRWQACRRYPEYALQGLAQISRGPAAYTSYKRQPSYRFERESPPDPCFECCMAMSSKTKLGHASFEPRISR